MDKITNHDGTSSPVWEQLETHTRGKIQEFVQQLLEEEVEELLGRKKSERRGPASRIGYRN
ncbi:MAG: IS256 family transposase, partial [Gemmatimonadaceae bacterium]